MRAGLPAWALAGVVWALGAGAALGADGGLTAAEVKVKTLPCKEGCVRVGRDCDAQCKEISQARFALVCHSRCQVLQKGCRDDCEKNAGQCEAAAAAGH